jgi:hypothetical protein
MKKFLLFPLLLSLGCAGLEIKRNLLTDFSLPSGSFDALPFDGGEKFVSVTAAKYLIIGQVFFEKSCGGMVRSFAILKNGDERQVLGSVGLPIKAVSCEEGITLQVIATEQLNRGEFITFNAYQDSGNSLTIPAKRCAQNNCASATWGTTIRLP